MTGAFTLGKLALPGFLAVCTAACAGGRIASIAGRIVAAEIFALCVCCVISQIGKPLHIGRSYSTSDTNLVNALLAFAVFGYPAGFYMIFGRIPSIKPKQPLESQMKALEE